MIYQKLATTAMKVIPSDRMQLLLLEEDGKSLSARQLWGDQIPGRETGNRFPLSGTLSEYVFNKRRAVSWSATQDFDVDAGAVPGMDPVRRAGVQATIGVPLMMHGEPIGVLFFNRFEDRSYTPQEITIASDIGDQITNVVVNFRSRQ